jgi:hypothetical protein
VAAGRTDLPDGGARLGADQQDAADRRPEQPIGLVEQLRLGQCGAPAQVRDRADATHPRFVIRKWNLRTPGREDDAAVDATTENGAPAPTTTAAASTEESSPTSGTQS